MRPSGSPETLQCRRERAIEMLKDGYQPVEVAAELKVDRQSVRRWRAAYREQGARALQATPILLFSGPDRAQRPPSKGVVSRKRSSTLRVIRETLLS